MAVRTEDLADRATQSGGMDVVTVTVLVAGAMLMSAVVAVVVAHDARVAAFV